MLPKEQRLAGVDFPPRSSKRTRNPLFLVESYRRRDGISVRNRFGVVISRVVDHRSVVRHRLKRDILRAVAEWPPRGLDILIVANKKAVQADFPTIRAELERSLQHIID